MINYLKWNLIKIFNFKKLTNKIRKFNLKKNGILILIIKTQQKIKFKIKIYFIDLCNKKLNNL